MDFRGFVVAGFQVYGFGFMGLSFPLFLSRLRFLLPQNSQPQPQKIKHPEVL